MMGIIQTIKDGTITFAKLAGDMVATAAQFCAGTAGKLLSADKVWDAAAWKDLGNVSGTVDVDLNEALNFYMTLTGDTTINVINPKAGKSFALSIQQDATGSRTVEFTLGGVESTWYGIGPKPTITPDANSVTIITALVGRDAAAVYYSGGTQTS